MVSDKHLVIIKPKTPDIANVDLNKKQTHIKIPLEYK